MDDKLKKSLVESVALAMREDVGAGDLTASLIVDGTLAAATVITRQAAIVCGTAWVDEVFRQLGDGVSVEWLAKDADRVVAGQTLCRMRGDARQILTGERTALNFLQMLSGTATITADYVAAVAGTVTQILDTRKTIPGHRLAQKYAVRCGGGKNHRVGLYDAILIKENHVMAAGGIAAAVAQARALHPGVMVEVEVESLAELREAVGAAADVVMLDNFDLANMRVAVNVVKGSAIKLEVSGNVTLADIRAYAETGVDFISIGALTKHLHAVDLSMRFEA